MKLDTGPGFKLGGRSYVVGVLEGTLAARSVQLLGKRRWSGSAQCPTGSAWSRPSAGCPCYAGVRAGGRTTCWPSSLWNFLTLESAMLRDSLLPVSGVIRPDVDATGCTGAAGGNGPGCSVGLAPPPLEALRAPSAAGVSPGSAPAPDALASYRCADE